MSLIKCSSIDGTGMNFDEKFYEIYRTTRFAAAFLTIILYQLLILTYKKNKINQKMKK